MAPSQVAVSGCPWSTVRLHCSQVRAPGAAGKWTSGDVVRLRSQRGPTSSAQMQGLVQSGGVGGELRISDFPRVGCLFVKTKVAMGVGSPPGHVRSHRRTPSSKFSDACSRHRRSTGSWNPGPSSVSSEKTAPGQLPNPETCSLASSDPGKGPLSLECMGSELMRAVGRGCGNAVWLFHVQIWVTLCSSDVEIAPIGLPLSQGPLLANNCCSIRKENFWRNLSLEAGNLRAAVCSAPQTFPPDAVTQE